MTWSNKEANVYMTLAFFRSTCRKEASIKHAVTGLQGLVPAAAIATCSMFSLKVSLRSFRIETFYKLTWTTASKCFLSKQPNPLQNPWNEIRMHFTSWQSLLFFLSISPEMSSFILVKDAITCSDQLLSMKLMLRGWKKSKPGGVLIHSAAKSAHCTCLETKNTQCHCGRTAKGVAWK